MGNIAIRVEGISKKYRIGARAHYATLRETLVNLVSVPFQRQDATIWALKDVSFEVKHGEAAAVIGHNGAGKSTLLRILSRITAPTEGRILIDGRVGSLLEVGTGFHSELTGRENVYLNGAILGMRKREIDRRFDEIVAFAEVEKFIDTPIKHFSSGMIVRLAFAVAAHLEPEILLVDEVLAVGDYAFQQKCLGKMNEVSQQGRTVLFVSHNMGAINRLCEIGILLKNGQLYLQGDIETLITHYLSLGASESGLVKLNAGTDTAIIHEVGVQNHLGEFSPVIGANQVFFFWVVCEIRERIDAAQLAVAVVAADGVVVFVTTHADTLEGADISLFPGQYHARVRIPAHFLNVGTYTLNVRVWGKRTGQQRESHADAFHVIRFRIEETGSVASKLNDRRGGLVTPLFEWEVANE